MQCPACEVLLEKKLKNLPGVRKVRASTAKGLIEFDLEPGQELPVTDIEGRLKANGYQLTSSGNENKNLHDYLAAVVVIVIIVLAVLGLEKINFGRFVNISASSGGLVFFLFGLTAGLSSCAALTGGILLSLTRKWNDINSNSGFGRTLPFIYFNTGRLISFLFFGGLLGFVGAWFSMSTAVWAVLIIVVSLMMIVVGLQNAGFTPSLKIKLSLPKQFTGYISDENNFQGRYLPAVVGILTFFVPCGFTLIAQTMAMTSGSWTRGAAMMFMFALGTLPVLALISFTSIKIGNNAAWQSKFGLISGVLIIILGLYSINSQLNVLGWKNINDLLRKPVRAELAVKGVRTPETSIQSIQLEAVGLSYRPENFVINSGIRTNLEVYDNGATGCAKALVGTGLFTGTLFLKPGYNSVEFMPQKGSYKITCSMGMVPPVYVEVL
jgi:sulfite exporter TauE/SafE/copper chaperone CopZ